MVKAEATDGVLIKVETDLYENVKLLEISSTIRNFAKRYGGTTKELKVSQTKLILFVEFNKNKQKKEFLKDAKMADLI